MIAMKRNACSLKFSAGLPVYAWSDFSLLENCPAISRRAAAFMFKEEGTELVFNNARGGAAQNNES